MNRRAVLFLTVTALVLAVMALTSCGDGGGSEQEEAKPGPLPEDPKALRPGEYHSTEFEPSFSFRVGKGWRTSSEFLQISNKLAIVRGEEDPPRP